MNLTAPLRPRGNRRFIIATKRNPLLFWKCTTAILALTILALLAIQHVARH
jgi:hypothetical protein